MIVLNQKNAQVDWDKFRESIRKNTPVDLNETFEERQARIKRLEGDHEEWKQYYFPKYYKYMSPAFHTRASRRMIKNFLQKHHWYEVRHWARGLAKSTVTMFDVLYLVMTGKLKNILLVSSTETAAISFLNKYMAQLDSNQRLINDYGVQELPGSWTKGDFTTRLGVKFMALGGRQTPRGTSNDEFRPDCILIDDFDTDEECLNEDIIEKKWKWFEEALFFTVDVSEPYLIVWLGNRIAEDCCVVRAGKMADHMEIVNIRDEYNRSTWPEKNKEADIDYQISKVSTSASQKELFNNPYSQGKSFKEMYWGKVPPISRFPYLVLYADPSNSNKDKGKGAANRSMKAISLVGKLDGIYYLLKCKVDHMNNSEFTEWIFHMQSLVGHKTTLLSYIENNSLQNDFYEQVFVPLFGDMAKKLNTDASIIPDDRDKPDKYVRIDGTLQPLNKLKCLILNEKEKEDPDMQRMVAQFLSVSPKSLTMDGPDSVEGAVWIIKTRQLDAGDIECFGMPDNKHHF